MFSIWEKQSFLGYDYIIVGSGIVGLSTAISLKENNKNASVLVLERGVFPTGASTKNAGFACFGSFTELLADIQSMGGEAALQIVRDRWNGLNKLRNRLGDEEIQFLNYGGYELLGGDELANLDKLQSVNQLLRPIFNKDVFSEKKNLVKAFGFNASKIHSVIHNPFEGQLDTGKMMKSLIRLASTLGIELLTGAEVTAIHHHADKVIVEVENGILKNRIAFEASGAAICTNAFSKKLLPNVDFVPGRGVVMVTNPILDLKFKGAFHFQEGYFYFRDYESRILFGGGRNLALEQEATTDFMVNEKILSVLNDYLKEVIIPGKAYEVAHVWTGIMAFGKTKAPFIEKINDRVVAGVRLGGMGVAIGTLVGEKLAKMLVD